MRRATVEQLWSGAHVRGWERRWPSPQEPWAPTFRKLSAHVAAVGVLGRCWRTWGSLGEGSATGVPLLSGTEGLWQWDPLLWTLYKHRGATQKLSGPPGAPWQIPALQTGARAAESVKEAGASSKVPASTAMGMLCIASPHARRSPGPLGGEAEGKAPREDQLTPDWKGDALDCPAPWLRASMEWGCGTRLPTCFWP